MQYSLELKLHSPAALRARYRFLFLSISVFVLGYMSFEHTTEGVRPSLPQQDAFARVLCEVSLIMMIQAGAYFVINILGLAGHYLMWSETKEEQERKMSPDAEADGEEYEDEDDDEEDIGGAYLARLHWLSGAELFCGIVFPLFTVHEEWIASNSTGVAILIACFVVSLAVFVNGIKAMDRLF